MTRLKRFWLMRVVRPMHRMEISPSVAGNTCAVGIGAGLIAPPLFQLVALAVLWPPLRLMRVHFFVPIAAVLTLISNPLTYLPIYSTYAVVGCMVTGCDAADFGIKAMLDLMDQEGVLAMLQRSGAILWILFIGGIPFAVGGAALAYLAGWQVGRRLADRRTQSRERRRQAAIARHQEPADGAS